MNGISQSYADSLNASGSQSVQWRPTHDGRHVEAYDKAADGSYVKREGSGSTRVVPGYENQLNKNFVDGSTIPRKVVATAGSLNSGNSAQRYNNASNYNGNSNTPNPGAPIASHTNGPNIPNRNIPVNNNTGVKQPGRTVIERDFSGNHGTAQRPINRDPHNFNPNPDDDNK